MPSIWWYLGRPSDSTRLSVSSTATSCTPGLRSFKLLPEPMIVLPVPTPFVHT
jgi:hypothetical protein